MKKIISLIYVIHKNDLLKDCYNFERGLIILNNQTMNKKDYEVLIINNGSPEKEHNRAIKIIKKICKKDFNFKYFWIPENEASRIGEWKKEGDIINEGRIVPIGGNYIYGMNIGVRNSESDIIAFLAGCRLPDKNLLEELYKPHIKEEKISVHCLGPRIGKDCSYHEIQQEYDFNKINKLIDSVDWKKDPKLLRKKSVYSIPDDYKNLYEGLWSIKKKYFIELGGMNERMPGQGLCAISFFQRSEKFGIKRLNVTSKTQTYHQWHPNTSRDNYGKNDGLRVKDTLFKYGVHNVNPDKEPIKLNQEWGQGNFEFDIDKDGYKKDFEFKGLKISILVLTWNIFDMFRLSIFTLLKEIKRLKKYGIIVELFIVDNGSTDGTVKWLKNKFIRIICKYNIRYKMILLEKNNGASVARNKAIKSMSKDSKYLLMLDASNLIVDNSLIEMIRFIEKNPLVGIIGMNSLGKYWTKDFYERTKSLNRIMKVDLQSRFKIHGYSCALTQYGFFRASLFNEYNLIFDEKGPFGKSGWGWEDDDLGIQIEQSGFLILAINDLKYFTLKHSSWKNLGIEKTDKMYAERYKYFIDKWGFEKDKNGATYFKTYVREFNEWADTNEIKRNADRLEKECNDK